ncbi:MULTISPECIES: PTS sugar transporter subunit IIB [Liquorilactobacillus]|uniref:PTS sugar transporter subunit IIB n=1 Tax=Liquorilactobacillus TaxID=2767888 RepID=UPI0021C289CC|nr:PTS sugar transporter subunit IIB [Liquorilactobacillus satsumensis]MCP9329768.1 PTS sugar transporter subunit IIB [Liquorilactobacillus satsumensis]
MLKLVRIDDRLVHGQVAVGWTSSVAANTIFVVNDQAQKDKVKAMALDLAKPAGVKLYIRGVKESGSIIKKFADAQKAQVLVLIRNIQDALALVKESGNAIRSINVGGLRFEEGKKKLNDFISLSDKDIEDLKELEELGVKLDFRMLPRDKKITLPELLKKG